jgi:hypothetical protein
MQPLPPQPRAAKVRLGAGGSRSSDLVDPARVTTDDQVQALATYLGGLLSQQAAHGRWYDRHYTGEALVEAAVRDYWEVFGPGRDGNMLLEPPRANLCRPGIDAMVERLRIEGFRVDADDSSGQGPDTGPGGTVVQVNDPQAAQVQRFWLDNDLDVMSPVAHTEALIKGTATLLAWPGVDGRAVLSVEDAEQMVVHRSSAPPYDVDAALKVAVDEWSGDQVAWLYTGRGLFRLLWDDQWWVDRSYAGGDIVQPLPPALGGQVPATELAVRPRLLLAPTSDLVDVTPLADMYNYVLAEMGIAVSFGAVPVRTATGIKLPRLRDSNGTPILDSQGNEIVDPNQPIDVRADRLLISENPDARFGTLAPSTLAGYVAALSTLDEQVRMQSRLPEHYMKGAKAGQSGDTLKASDANLVRGTNRVATPFGGSWRRAVRHGLLIDGSPIGRHRITTRWADSETRILAQEVDAALKLTTNGVPLEQVLEETMKWDPVTIQQAMAGRDAQSGPAQEILAAARQRMSTAGVPGPQPTALLPS